MCYTLFNRCIHCIGRWMLIRSIYVSSSRKRTDVDCGPTENIAGNSHTKQNTEYPEYTKYKGVAMVWWANKACALAISVRHIPCTLSFPQCCTGIALPIQSNRITGPTVLPQIFKGMVGLNFLVKWISDQTLWILPNLFVCLGCFGPDSHAVRRS